MKTFALVLASLGLVATAARAGEPVGLLLVANKADDTVSFVDLAGGKVVGTATTGHHPHELAVSPDGRTAFVANYGAGDSISVIDVRKREERRKITLGRYRDPHGLQVNRDGTRLYATCEASRAVIEVDIGRGEIVRAFDTGREVSHMLVLTPDEKKLYVADLGAGSATAIDRKSGEIVAQIATGAGCEGIDVRPDGREVWTTNKAAGTVSVIDTATDRVGATLTVPGRPIRVKFTPDGRRALVSCAEDNRVAVLDVETRREVKRIAVGRAPIGLVIEPGGRRAYVADTEEDRVSVLDLDRLAVIGTFAVGREPDGLGLAVPKDD